MNAEIKIAGFSIFPFMMLQWGRVRMNAEIERWQGQEAKAALASMGPRSDERGNVRVAPPQTLFAGASMGPRSDERGNFELSVDIMEILAASMGPRSDERGNVRWHCESDFSELASMGPRSDERGN